ncbi:MAG: class II fructose-1,6-bisphosphate aldolase [Firmicutes bacterium]|nr:class II fructose-1,6-bisphosphate aldolase [Bacillota bacterium]
MSKASLKQLLERAASDGYAVGAFNMHTLESMQAIVAAAESQRAPLILQINESSIKYAGARYLAALARVAADLTDIPVAIHLDHGRDFNVIVQCIRHGFTSVMIDASKLPLADNISEVREIVKIAHAAGVDVEAELGRVGGTEDDISVSEQEAGLTDPNEAQEFVAETGVDALAVAIGTAHGVYRGEPKLNYSLLSELRQRLEVPLVLHGGSGVPDQSIKKCIELGISKINISTELKIPFAAKLRDTLAAAPNEFDPRKILGPTRDAVSEVVINKIKLLGCGGQC